MKKESYKKRFWLTTLAALSIVAIFGSCKDEFDEVVGVCPEVESTNPVNEAIGVQLNNVIDVTFNEPLNPESVTPGVFSLRVGSAGNGGVLGDELSGELTYGAGTNKMSFMPTSNLSANTIYTGRVEPVVKDMMGNALQAPYIWTFTTGSTPTVVATDPVNLSTGVPLDKDITATFSMPMDSLTVTAATFQLMAGTTQVSGEVVYSGTTATFSPTGGLMAGTTYTGVITIEAKNKEGIPLAMAHNWTFDTGTAPRVVSVDPMDLATGVMAEKTILVKFSEPMDPATISTSTFTVKMGLLPVAGTVTYSDSTAIFTPTADLLSSTVYTVSILKLAKSPNGVPMASDFTSKFTTGNFSVPEVTTTDPANNATGVVLNKAMLATFTEAMDAATISATTFTVKQGNTAVAGTVTYSGTTATFTPIIPLLPNLVYTGTITTGAKNVSGTGLVSNFVWSFTTVAPIAPVVITTDPLNNATNVARNKMVRAIFSIPMDPASINGVTFTLRENGNNVAGNVSYDGITASFSPSELLLPNMLYTATITTGASSLVGTMLVTDHVWNFRVENPISPYFVDLKTAGRFGIFAATGVSNNAGFCEIRNSDVGITPGARSSVTGFPPALMVNGAIFASDDTSPAGVAAMLSQAKLDLTAAYLFAEGATSPAPATVAGDQGGKTLAPGIYKSNSTLLIQAGDLTLDAQGDPNAVWIFQIAAGFTTVGGSGGNIILSGGAQAKNIFWQVGSSATIGDKTIFKGNVLAFTSITMNSGAKIEGRMLVLNGAVVMTNTNIIERP